MSCPTHRTRATGLWAARNTAMAPILRERSSKIRHISECGRRLRRCPAPPTPTPGWVNGAEGDQRQGRRSTPPRGFATLTHVTGMGQGHPAKARSFTGSLRRDLDSPWAVVAAVSPSDVSDDVGAPPSSPCAATSDIAVSRPGPVLNWSDSVHAADGCTWMGVAYP